MITQAGQRLDFDDVGIPCQSPWMIIAMCRVTLEGEPTWKRREGRRRCNNGGGYGRRARGRDTADIYKPSEADYLYQYVALPALTICQPPSY